MWRLVLLVALVVCAQPLLAAPRPEHRFTGATPDETIGMAREAILAGEPAALARVMLIADLRDRATGGLADGELAAVAASTSPVATDARWLLRALTPEERTAIDLSRDDDGRGPAGLVRAFAIMGPYEDVGGGLDRKEGPDREGFRFEGADDSWGVYAVRPQRTIVAQVDARGVPLDVYVAPRRESCSYLATVIAVPSPEPFVVHLASVGSFRLSIDGREAARGEALHPQARLDRAAVRVVASTGDHTIVVKTCSGSRDDAGRVRLRLSDPEGRDLALAASSDLARLDGAKPGEVEITPETTALEVALSRRGSPGEMLGAAVVAILAGADDLRSSAAPGWLDDVVARGASADELALAGYVAPFAAQRSGWLAQALAGSDETAKSFAQRALVRARLSVGATDLAAATAQRKPLAGATDADARLIAAEVAASQGARGLALRARSDAEALLSELGARAPTRAFSLVVALDPTPAKRLAAHRALAQRNGERGLAFVRAHEPLGTAAVVEAARLALLDQPSTSATSALAGYLFSLGAHRPAVEAHTLAASLSPNHPQAMAGLARALAMTASGSEAHLAALERALELDPSNALLKAQLDLRLGAQTSDPGEDARWIVAPRVFLDRATEAPSDGVAARQLHWRRVVRMHADKRVSELIHYAREIVVVPRTEDERYENLPGDWGSELLFARVHRKDGTVAEPEERDDEGPTVRWPELERGDVVEVALRSWTGPVGRRGDAPYYFVDYVGSLDTEPVLYNEVILDVAPGAPLAWDVIGGTPDETKTETIGDRRVTRLIWNDPPSLPDEPWSPPSSELLPLVVGSAYPGWSSFLDWYRGAVEGFTTPDAQIERLARELTEGKTTRDEKIAALFTFVADDIRYVNFRSGEWWLPNRPQDLLARRQGDCDDKAMLLISLLRALGIEAREVLVQTRMTRQPRVMQSDQAAIPMFDHGIIYLPDESGEGGRFLDATSPESRMGSLPAMDGGAVALLVEADGTPKLIRTPLGSASDHGVGARWTLTLDERGGGTLAAVERHVGDSAFQLRTHLGREDARAQWVEQNLIAGWFAGLTMRPDVAFSPDLADGAAEVRFEAESTALARREGRDLVVTIAPPTPLTTILAPLPVRTLPVDLPPSVAPQHRDLRVEVVAPPGYVFAEPPPDAEVDAAPHGSARLRFSRSADHRRATIERTVALEAARIPVADYVRWRRFLREVDAILQRGLRLVPSPR
jgi:tetratricopeptide (TPR) repeat protein